MLRKLFVFVVCLMAAVATASAQTPPYNEIWYTTTDGRPLFINSGYKESVDLYMYSDTYDNGRGVLKFKSGGYINFIKSGLFNGKDRLKSITIPDIVTSIGWKAFMGCSSLTSINIPDSVTSIGEGAFKGCSSLTSINIPNSVTLIRDFAFSGCSSLTSITIPNSVTSIEWMAFDDCSSLTSITIPNSVTSIGFCAFSGCSSLTSITIGNSVTSIDSWAFNGCSSLKSVKVANKYCYDYFKDKVANIAFYGANASADGICLIVNGKLQRFIGKGITEYTIPESVTSIGGCAFEGCSSLPVIDNIRYADTYRIEAVDESLTSYSIKKGTRLIGGSAFNDCSSLTSITIPNSVTNIGDYAFYNCDNLTSITCLATTPPAIDDLMIAETTMIYVPEEAVKTYKKDPNWSRYKKQIKAIE